MEVYYCKNAFHLCKTKCTCMYFYTYMCVFEGWFKTNDNIYSTKNSIKAKEPIHIAPIQSQLLIAILLHTSMTQIIHLGTTLTNLTQQAYVCIEGWLFSWHVYSHTLTQVMMASLTHLYMHTSLVPNPPSGLYLNPL